MLAISVCIVSTILSFTCTKANDVKIAKENDYLKISHTEINSYQKFLDAYFTLTSSDGKKRSEKNLLVGFVKNNSECFQTVINSAPLRASQRVSGLEGQTSVTVIDTVFPVSILNNYECGKISFYSYNTTVLNPKASTTEFENRQLIGWISEQFHVDSLKFVNHFDHPLAVYWMDDAKDPILQGYLRHKGDEFTISTTLGHIFVARQGKS